MDAAREKLYRDVMAADFTLIDLNLYLNTHPYDMKAIMLYNNFVTMARTLRDNYERRYGPLTPAAYSTCPWQWIEPPWPWERRQ